MLSIDITVDLYTDLKRKREGLVSSSINYVMRALQEAPVRGRLEHRSGKERPGVRFSHAKSHSEIHFNFLEPNDLHFAYRSRSGDTALLDFANGILNQLSQESLNVAAKIKEVEIEATFDDGSIDFPFYRLVNENIINEISGEASLALIPTTMTFDVPIDNWDAYVILPFKSSKHDTQRAMSILSQKMKNVQRDVIAESYNKYLVLRRQLLKIRHGGIYI